jgi:hypothetical protein
MSTVIQILHRSSEINGGIIEFYPVGIWQL